MALTATRAALARHGIGRRSPARPAPRHALRKPSFARTMGAETDGDACAEISKHPLQAVVLVRGSHPAADPHPRHLQSPGRRAGHRVRGDQPHRAAHRAGHEQHRVLHPRDGVGHLHPRRGSRRPGVLRLGARTAGRWRRTTSRGRGGSCARSRPSTRRSRGSSS